MITALGYLIDQDPGVRASDSLVWWFNSFRNIWVGWTIIWDEPNLMRVLPWPFLMCLPVYNLYNIFLMGIDGPYFLETWFYAFVYWVIFSGLHQFYLRRSFRSMHEDYIKYEETCKAFKTVEHDAVALVDLDRYCVTEFSSLTKRPAHLMSAGKSACDTLPLPFASAGLLNQRRRHKIESLDTLYIQAMIIEPIFLEKIAHLVDFLKSQLATQLTI